jgi:RNA polymerase sigma factor (TIGR02999 family)
MTNGSDPAITRMLTAVSEGDPGAADALLPLVYDALRKLARSKMHNATPGHTLQPTALVHEAYLRVVGSADPGWNSRGHFFGAAAQAMRRILVEQARRKARRRQAAARDPVDVDEVELPIEAPSDDVVLMDEVLERLEAADPFNRQIVNLRYFVGLTAEDTAAALGVSVWAVERQWRFIRTWLRRELDNARGN